MSARSPKPKAKRKRKRKPKRRHTLIRPDRLKEALDRWFAKRGIKWNLSAFSEGQPFKPTTVQRWLDGGNDPSGERWMAVSVRLEVGPLWLAGLDVPREENEQLIRDVFPPSDKGLVRLLHLLTDDERREVRLKACWYAERLLEERGARVKSD